MSNSYDKENYPNHGNMLYPHEKLGTVPEQIILSNGKKSGGSIVTRRTKKKLADLSSMDIDMDSYIDGGQKRLAVIDPLQALNGRARIAQRLFISPIRTMSIQNKKRSASSSLSSLEMMKGVEDGTKRIKITTPSSTSASTSAQSSEQEKLSMTKFDNLSREDLFNAKLKSAKTRIEMEKECDVFMESVNNVQVDDRRVFDSCPEVVEKINQFYKKYKLIDRSLLYRSLGVHGNSFNAFIQGYNQERCNNATYPKAYIFFEKLRIYLGEPKSESRLFNESNYPYGFSLKKPSKKKTTSAFRAPSVGYEFC